MNLTRSALATKTAALAGYPQCYADSKEFDVTRNVPVEHEAAFVKAFIVRAKQERYLELLSKPKRRQAVLRSLAHFSDLDPQIQVPIPPSEQAPSRLEQLLRSRGAPSECYLISEDAALDGRTIALSEALTLIVGRGMGTLLSCIPGHLGYYEGEDRGARWLLERGAA